MATVPGYVHTPGNHCGSTALRNLLAFHGVEISEEMAFGLGAGAGFYYLALEDGSLSRWFNGRTARLEESFRELTGAALELRTFPPEDGEAAWEAAEYLETGQVPQPMGNRHRLTAPYQLFETSDKRYVAIGMPNNMLRVGQNLMIPVSARSLPAVITAANTAATPAVKASKPASAWTSAG